MPSISEAYVTLGCGSCVIRNTRWDEAVHRVNTLYKTWWRLQLLS
jgi:hypothetical protein